MTIRVLVADRLHGDGVMALEDIPGVEVQVDPGLNGATLVEAARSANVLVVRSTRVGRDVLEGAPGLSLVVRAGAGVNTIDLEAAGDRGIFVSNCPGMNADAVAELTLGLMLALDRSIPACDASMRAGRWQKKRFSAARGLRDRTLGVLGVGAIGEAVLKRARAFEMELVAWSRSLTEADAARLGCERCESPREVAERADIVSVHLALCDQTRGIVNAELLAAMPDGSVLINTSRAGLVDADALCAELRSGRLRAGLDVHPDEPSGGEGDWVARFAEFDGVVGTHHIGASTEQALRATALEAARIVECFLMTGEAPNCVNLRAQRETPYGIVVRHADRVGILAGVLEILKTRGHNVQEMENRIFVGKRAACAKIGLERRAEQALLDALAACDGVFHVSPVGEYEELS